MLKNKIFKMQETQISKGIALVLYKAKTNEYR